MAKKTVNVEAQTITQEVPFEMYPANAENKFVYLHQLIALDSTPIPHAKIAMREVSTDHVDNLFVSILAGDQLKPIKVVPSNVGWIIVDGYHRTAAYTKHLIQVLKDSNNGNEPTPEEIVEARKGYSIAIEEIDVVDNIDILDKAFAANLDHGLPASPASRSRYALWLIEQAASKGQELTVRAAARKARVSHVAVLHAQKRLATKDTKMNDKLTSEDEDEVNALIEEDVANADDSIQAKTEKHVKALIAAVKFIHNQDMTTDELTLYLKDFGERLEKQHATEGIRIFNVLYGMAKEDSAPAPIEQQQLV